jgi:6-pyruvoyltetrahydropterin/6-carboxytetrahydropterin synthase
MKIAKEFHWEMGHRLPYHNGLCRNLHGHSYKMIVEIEGKVSKNGMIIDFFELNNIIKPLIQKYDHAFLVWENDTKLLKFLKQNKLKNVIFDKHSTVENICGHFLDLIYKKLNRIKNIELDDITIKVFESPNAYAEISRNFNEQRNT